MKRLALAFLLLAGCATAPEPAAEPPKEQGYWITNSEAFQCAERGGVRLGNQG